MGWEKSVLCAERDHLLCHCAALSLPASAGSCLAQRLTLCCGLQSCRSSPAFHCDPMWHPGCTDSGMYSVCGYVPVGSYKRRVWCAIFHVQGKRIRCDAFIDTQRGNSVVTALVVGRGRLNVNMHRQDVCACVSVLCCYVYDLLGSRFITMTMWETALSLLGKSRLCHFLEEQYSKDQFWGKKSMLTGDSFNTPTQQTV